MTLNIKKVHISLFCSVILWAVVTDAWGYSSVLFGNMYNNWGEYLYGLVSRGIWSIPFIVLIIKCADNIPANFKGLFSLKWHWKSVIIALSAITVYILVGMFVNHGGFWVNQDVRISQILLMFLMVGFAEEIVYRGFGMNAFQLS